MKEEGAGSKCESEDQNEPRWKESGRRENGGNFVSLPRRARTHLFSFSTFVVSCFASSPLFPLSLLNFEIQESTVSLLFRAQEAFSSQTH